MAGNQTLGIDPGMKGGAVLLDSCGDIVDMAAFDHEPFGDFMKRINVGGILRAYCEKVGSMPKQGLASTFKFGTEYGFVLGGLYILNISTELVAPQRWQKKMLPGLKAGTSKPRAVEKAKQLQPYVNFLATDRSRVAHSGLVDAYMIAEYGRTL